MTSVVTVAGHSLPAPLRAQACARAREELSSGHFTWTVWTVGDSDGR